MARCWILNLCVGSALPVAKILSDRHIPFAFMTGDEAPRGDVPCCPCADEAVHRRRVAAGVAAHAVSLMPLRTHVPTERVRSGWCRVQDRAIQGGTTPLDGGQQFPRPWGWFRALLSGTASA